MKNSQKNVWGRWLRGILVTVFCVAGWSASGQMPGGTPVERSSEQQTISGRKYYVHVVQQGQTVYSISRAYGVKDYDAVVKKDIHFLSVGDTVWIPVKKASPADGQASPATNTPSKTPETKKSETKKTETTPAAEQVVVKPRVDKERVVVSLLMPLYLDQLEGISTTKFDVEQRGRKSYKQFEFVQFYEGVEMALRALQERGCSVTLNVVDVSDNSASAVEREWERHEVGKSDVVVAMLLRDAFGKAAELARRDGVFIVNPMSSRSEIVKGNPYVVKCQPSVDGKVAAMLRYIRRQKPGAHIFIVHSGSPAERPWVDAFTRQLESQKANAYTLFSWTANGKLGTAVKGIGEAVFISLYDKGKEQNRTFVNTLLGRLSSISSHCDVTLMTAENWCDQYKDVDIGHLQKLNYYTFDNGWDFSDERQKRFIEDFRLEYKTEPTGNFAAMGNDAILYFVTGIWKKADFWKDPNIGQVEGMIHSLKFEPRHGSDGLEGQSAMLSRLVNYHFVECGE